MKLALGTVQLGIPYGMASQTGMPYDATALATLQVVRDNRCEWLETSSLNARLFERAISSEELAMSLGACLDDAAIVLSAETAKQLQKNAKFAAAHRHREIAERWLHEHPPITKAVFTSSLWPAA